MRCASWHLCEASPDACMSCFHDRPLALVAVQNEPTRGVLDASAPALLEETADVGELQERQWWSEPPVAEQLPSKLEGARYVALRETYVCLSIQPLPSVLFRANT